MERPAAPACEAVAAVVKRFVTGGAPVAGAAPAAEIGARAAA
jgi:hypothetical protein